jgi:hypothetical protein
VSSVRFWILIVIIETERDLFALRRSLTSATFATMNGEFPLTIVALFPKISFRDHKRVAHKQKSNCFGKNRAKRVREVPEFMK